MTRIIIQIAIIIALVFAFFACNRLSTDKKLELLSAKAEQINNDFKKIRLETDMLSAEIANLYSTQSKILPTINTSKYQLAVNGVFTKPLDDGGSAIFVSGVYPVSEKIKKIVYFTEPIDSNFKALVKKYPEIVQVYYNDMYSYNRIYPFFDVLSQLEAKMDIPSFNFYYLADEIHNPSKNSVWVNEPYVDPAGRGWMVSAIAPVYISDKLVGVPGIDVTINTITKRYLQDTVSSTTVIIDANGGLVTAQEDIINLFSFPPLYDHKYIETIKQDTYRKELYNMALSRDATVRKIATEVLKNKKQTVTVDLNGEKTTIIAAPIPELNWYLLEVIR